MADRPKRDDYLRRGYLPENLPPSFTTEQIADYFSGSPENEFLSRSDSVVMPALYNASKRGMTRRTFAVVHPVTAFDLAEFSVQNSKAIWKHLEQTNFSSSIPRKSEDNERALEITSHAELERIRLEKLARFRFIAKTDVSRFYHSIYTHSVPWAFHGKAAAKKDRKYDSNKLPFNRLDFILRCGQDGQTVGVPVGPDVSRLVSEGIFSAIDTEFYSRCNIEDYEVVRHVDDIWIGVNSHAEAEQALWRYRDAIRSFELDINESKTHIYSDNFRFTDTWPTEISERIDYALNSNRRVEERLRVALEFAFNLAATGGDDGVAKYVIRYLDRLEALDEYWETFEPYLKRTAIHFGHSLDYVSRILVWKKLRSTKFRGGDWPEIFHSILGRHGKLGNDSEVVWSLYASEIIGTTIDKQVAEDIIQNCGALPMLSMLNMADDGLAHKRAFDVAREVLATEDASGGFWPVIMEWHSRDWPHSDRVQLDHQTIEDMSRAEVTMFGRASRTKVFAGHEADSFKGVLRAIEGRVSYYDDEDEDDDDDGFPTDDDI